MGKFEASESGIDGIEVLYRAKKREHVAPFALFRFDYLEVVA